MKGTTVALKRGLRGIYFARVSLASVLRTETLLPHKLRPLLITINLTENCQAKCVTCNYWHTNKKDAISTTRAKRLMEEIRETGFRYLRFLGGEPLLRKDLFEVLEHVSPQAFKRVTLATNGLLLGRFAARVNQSPISHLTVSLDGLADTNAKLRGSSHYFDTVMANLERIEGKRIKIVSIANRFLAQEVEELAQLCKDRGYDYDVCLPSRLLPFANTSAIAATLEDIWPTEAQTDRIFGTLLAHGLVTRSIAKGAKDYLVHGRFPFSRCVLPYIETRILANGEVRLGCYEVGLLGNLVDSSLADLLRSPLASKLARPMYRLECSRCLINWRASRAFQRPLTSLSYVRRRLG